MSEAKTIPAAIPAVEGGRPVRASYLTFGSPAIEEAEIEEVVACLRSGWLGTGPRVAQFEKDFKTYHERPDTSLTL